MYLFFFSLWMGAAATIPDNKNAYINLYGDNSWRQIKI